MKTLEEQNAELLVPDTLKDEHSGKWRGVLSMPSKRIRWWVCEHHHLVVGYAWDCAEAAHEEVRAGVKTHRLKGLSDDQRP
jgi:hypothetical protein